MSLKSRLATIPISSKRYKLVHAVYGTFLEKSRPKKACLFYCVMMPSSAVVWIFTLYVGLWAGFMQLAAGWLLGRWPSWLKDRGLKPPQRLSENTTGRFAYPYKYSPLRGKCTRVAPWQILSPVAIGILIWQHWQWKLLKGTGVGVVLFALTCVVGVSLGIAISGYIATSSDAAIA